MQNVGRIYLDGKPWGEDMPYPIQQTKIKGLVANGITKNRLELHKPVYPGVINCKQCGYMAVKPALMVYDTSEYWRCACGKMNYV